MTIFLYASGQYSQSQIRLNRISNENQVMSTFQLVVLVTMLYCSWFVYIDYTTVICDVNRPLKMVKVLCCILNVKA